MLLVAATFTVRPALKMKAIALLLGVQIALLAGAMKKLLLATPSVKVLLGVLATGRRSFAKGEPKQRPLVVALGLVGALEVPGALVVGDGLVVGVALTGLLVGPAVRQSLRPVPTMVIRGLQMIRIFRFPPTMLIVLAVPKVVLPIKVELVME